MLYDDGLRHERVKLQLISVSLPFVPTPEAVAQRSSVKRCSQKFRKIHRKAPVPQACNFIKKESLAQVFHCEFCKISKNAFSYRTSPMAARLTVISTRFYTFTSLLYLFLLICQSFTLSGPQGFYQSKSFHFSKYYYLWHTKQLVVVPMSIRLLVSKIFLVTPVSLWSSKVINLVQGTMVFKLNLTKILFI